METGAMLSIEDIAKLLQGGGSVGTIVIVYIGFRLKDAVTKYLTGVNETLAQLKQGFEEMRRIQDNHAQQLAELRAAQAMGRGRFVPSARHLAGTGEGTDV